MDIYILSNNPLVKELDYKIKFVEGDFIHVLTRARDLVHTGHSLISSPLAASIRMIYSPYRSIILSENKGQDIDLHVEIIENSIENYKKSMGVRQPDFKNKEDYALIDKKLILSAMEEHNRLNTI